MYYIYSFIDATRFFESFRKVRRTFSSLLEKLFLLEDY